LRAIAARSEKQPEVRIVPGVRTRYEQIIFVMDVARAAGLKDAALADADPGAV
jgi:biopolymer transport protein ExbD